MPTLPEQKFRIRSTKAKLTTWTEKNIVQERSPAIQSEQYRLGNVAFLLKSPCFAVISPHLTRVSSTAFTLPSQELQLPGPGTKQPDSAGQNKAGTPTFYWGPCLLPWCTWWQPALQASPQEFKGEKHIAELEIQLLWGLLACYLLFPTRNQQASSKTPVAASRTKWQQVDNWWEARYMKTDPSLAADKGRQSYTNRKFNKRELYVNKPQAQWQILSEWGCLALKATCPSLWCVADVQECLTAQESMDRTSPLSFWITQSL